MPNLSVGLTACASITRTRSALGNSTPNQTRDEGEEEESADSDDSDRKSKMSFSYWGADKVTLAIPPGKKAKGVQAKATPTRRGNAPSSYVSFSRIIQRALLDPSPTDFNCQRQIWHKDAVPRAS